MLEERKCPTCGAVYLPPADQCLKEDHQPLVTTNTLVGRVLDRRYRIDQVLGVGGMGAVYRSTHLGFGKEFAVKVLHPEMMEREDMFERFRNEARAAGRIEHDKAVKVTDFGVTEEKLAYLVMEIVEGVLLRTLINPTGLEVRRTVELLAQVCEAVQAAHQKNIIHRDLKPDNIIVQQVDGKERVKVLDFGIAKLREADQEGSPRVLQTKVGMLVGTPQYMSPEQCRGMRGEELKPTSDIYSLGIIAYEMLSGRLPFTANNTLGYISQHSYEPAPPLHVYARQVPPRVEQVVMRALEKDPANRQQSAFVFAQELQAAVSEAALHRVGATVKLPPQTEVIEANAAAAPDKAGRLSRTTLLDPFTTKLVETVKPQRWAWVMLAVLLLALLGYGGYQMLQRRGRPAPPREQLPALQAQKISDDFGVMILLPAGTFEMGRDDGEDDEGPKHSVAVKAFYLDETEVTNQQYKKFVEATKHPLPEHWKNNGTYALEEALFPVTHVTWTDATAYAKWAGKRLPTETEWEYAARGGQAGLLYPWGNAWRDEYANAGRASSKLVAVGIFEKDQSPFGVRDLAGNVSEWVENLHLRYNTQQPVFPQCPTCRVYRGGNYNEADSRKLTNTFRWSFFPDLPQDPKDAKDYRESVFPVVGFRCAKDVPLR